MSTPKWTDERTAQLEAIVADITGAIPQTVVADAAAQLETSTRSIAAKLRKIGKEVEPTSAVATKAFSDEEEAKLRKFVEANSGVYTYAEIAQAVFGGDKSAKAVQGKLLSMELTSAVKPTPKVEVAKQYTSDEEATFLSMAKSGAFLEDIAEALGKTLNSVRGKALSLSRSEGIEIPKQRASHASTKEDALVALGDVSGLTVAEIAEKTGKTERGVKTMLTRRGINVADYAGADRKAKLSANDEAE